MTARHARILAVAEHRPATVVDNAELCARLDTTDDWIRTRTGIRTRRVASDGETVVGMAAAAAAKAAAAAGVTPADIDLVILATCTLRAPIPGGAPLVASALGTNHAAAFDLNAACGGFCYALAVAADLVRAGTATTVVVAGADRMTDWIDQTDRQTAILFGDGAGAVVVGAAEETGIWPVAWGSDGSAAGLVGIPDGESVLGMQGPALFRWISERLPEVARRACELAGVSVADVRALIPHQANLRIVDGLARALHLPATTVVARDVVDAGNTSSASVPLALARLLMTHEVSSGDLALLVSVGAGLTYASQVIRIP